MLKHTPYAAGSSPFEIGLTPLDLKNWIEVDGQLSHYLAEKQRLVREMQSEVFVGDYASEAAQEEVLNLLVEHLLEQFPNIYTRNGNVISIDGVQHHVDLDDFSVPPLLQAAMLVQEDLVLMRKEGNAWHLVAGAVCFPSSWVLREKIGRPMHGVHAPVPGYHEGTRNAVMIERIFDNLQVELPVERFNWSIYSNGDLFQGGHLREHILDKDDAIDDYHIRVEHQTLRKLPKTENILFTIRIYSDPLDALSKREDKSELANEFLQTLGRLSKAQIVYKGMEASMGKIVSKLKEIAE